jgi:hypothetical protein
VVFTDGVQLMSAVRGLQGLAASAQHHFEEQESAQLLSDVAGGNGAELEAMQAGGMLPSNDQLGAIMQNANTLLSVHVEDVPELPPETAHPAVAPVDTIATRDFAPATNDDAPVVEQGLAFSVATLGDKDAQVPAINLHFCFRCMFGVCEKSLR